MTRKRRVLRQLLLLALLVVCFSVPARAGNVRLNYTWIKMTEGETMKLRVKGTKAKVKWSSSRKAVASVSKNGKVLGRKPGKAVITARVSGSKYTCKVTVTKRIRKPATPSGDTPSGGSNGSGSSGGSSSTGGNTAGQDNSGNPSSGGTDHNGNKGNGSNTGSGNGDNPSGGNGGSSTGSAEKPARPVLGYTVGVLATDKPEIWIEKSGELLVTCTALTSVHYQIDDPRVLIIPPCGYVSYKDGFGYPFKIEGLKSGTAVLTITNGATKDTLTIKVHVRM